jgi:MFS family permease
MFVFIGNLYAAGISTGFVALATEFHVGFDKLNDVISYPVLALGVGNLFWTPAAICFGKRPIIIVSMVMFLACSIWSIYVNTLSELVASRVLACFGLWICKLYLKMHADLCAAAGSVESLGPAIIADVYQERYFATAMAIFSLSLSGGSQIGPTIAGFLIKSRGWRWFFILNTILIACNLTFTLLLLPETNYKRHFYTGETAAEVDKSVVDEVEHVKGADEIMAHEYTGHVSSNVEYAGSYFKDLFAFKSRGVENGHAALLKQFSLPFRFVLIPHVLFAVASYGVFLGG